MKLKSRHALLYAGLFLFVLVQLFPLYWLLTFSLKTNGEIFAGNILGLPENWLWENYIKAVQGGSVLLYFFNSILVTFTSIGLSVLFAAMAAYGLVRMKWPWSKVVFTLFLTGIMIPLHSALLPLFLILKEMKLLNSYLALIIPYAAFGIPVAVLIFSGFLESVPRSLEESAMIEGASIYQIFFKIIFPMIKSAVATVVIFLFLSNWNELMFAVTFISKKAFKTLPVGIMSLSSQYKTAWGPIGAALMISVLPSLLTYLLISGKVQESIQEGAIKG